MTLPTNQQVTSFFKSYGYAIFIIFAIVMFLKMQIFQIISKAHVATLPDCTLDTVESKKSVSYNNKTFTLDDLGYYEYSYSNDTLYMTFRELDK